MTETPQNQTDQTPAPRPRRLLRSRERIIFGVAGGLADYFRLDPTLIRVGFVVAALVGGFGILPYLILALVVPMDDGSGQPERRDRPPMGLIVLAVIALLIFLPGPFWGPWDHGGGWWWAWGGGWLLLIGLGALGAYLVIKGREGNRDGARTPEQPTAGAPAPGAHDAGEGESPTATTAQISTAAARESSPADSSPRADGRQRAVRLIGVVLLTLAALCVACAVAAVSAWTVATGNGEIAAAVVIATGAAVIAAAATGARLAPWLIIPALVVALPAGATAASDIRFDGDFGERQYSPTTAAEIRTDGYQLGVGQLIVDLQQLRIRPGQAIEVRTDLGVGQSIVSVPPNACVQVDAHGSAGELYFRGERSDGVDPDLSEDPPRTRAPRLILDTEIDLGQLLISERPADALQAEEDHFGDATHLDDAQERADAEAACRR